MRCFLPKAQNPVNISTSVPDPTKNHKLLWLTMSA